MRASVGLDRGKLRRLWSRRWRVMAPVSITVASVAGWGTPALGGMSTPSVCNTQHFHTVPRLSLGAVCMNLGVQTHDTRRGSYLFLTPDFNASVFEGGGAGIYTNRGTLVWWRARANSLSEDQDLTVVQLRGRRYLALYSGTTRRIGNEHNVTINDGTVVLYDHHYRQVGQITAARPFHRDQIDMHEFRITRQGTALFGVYDPVARRVNGQAETVVQYVVQEVSLVKGPKGIHTGRVLFQWRSLKQVPPSQSHIPDPGPGGAWDYFHGNSIARDSDGNLVISARNTWGIYKLNVKTGRIMWQLGTKANPGLREQWCYQHDLTPLGHNTYSVFDDGTLCHQARGLIFRVHPAKTHPATVSLVGADEHRPAIHSAFLGSSQLLPGGSEVVDWGSTPEITEFGPRGGVRLDLSLSEPSYRGFQFSWRGWPVAPPAVAAHQQGSGTEIWASWNGSTQVSAWRPLAGGSSRSLTPVGKPVGKSGFETAIWLHRHYRFVAVQALNSRGRVIGTSKAVGSHG